MLRGDLRVWEKFPRLSICTIAITSRWYPNLPERNFLFSFPRAVKQSLEYVTRNNKKFLSGGLRFECGRVALEESLEPLTREVGPSLSEWHKKINRDLGVKLARISLAERRVLASALARLFSERLKDPSEKSTFWPWDDCRASSRSKGDIEKLFRIYSENLY
jgi:hypothetical protein